MSINKQKRAWNIGKITEKKTKDKLLKQGMVVFKTDVDSAGVDIMAFNNENGKPTIYLIEVKGTEKQDVKWTQRFSKKQFNKYKVLQHRLEEKGFNVKFQLWFYRLINNKWKCQIYDFTDWKFR